MLHYTGYSKADLQRQENTGMMYYYMTKSKGRAGTSGCTYRKCEAASKAEVKRRYSSKFAGKRVVWVMTEAEVEALPEASAKVIKERAI